MKTNNQKEREVMNHTPTPWEVLPQAMGIRSAKVYGGGVYEEVVDLSHYENPKRKANAELIVRAVNAHEDLVNAFENILRLQPKSLLEDFAYQGPEGASNAIKKMGKYYEGFNACLLLMQKKAEQALTKASGGKNA